jgi:hypothetical protein
VPKGRPSPEDAAASLNQLTIKMNRLTETADFVFFSAVLRDLSSSHGCTGLKSDLFSSGYTKCLKQVEKGDDLYGASNKKVRWRARGVWDGNFTCGRGASFAVYGTIRGSTGPHRGQLVDSRTSIGGQLVHTGDN